MATRYRALAAPVDVSTGDGRRFAPGAITMGELPLPIRFAREDYGGHDGAVTVGAIEAADLSADSIWVTVRMFDDISREDVPELATAVAHAMALIAEGVVGLSVDLDDFEACPVLKGTGEPLDMDQMMADPDAELELLVTRGRVRAATLVDIPAYAETSGNFQLLEDSAGEDADEPVAVGQLSGDAAAYCALVAHAGTTTAYPVTVFAPPVEITGPTPITYDLERGVAYGHIYQHGVCHVGISDECRMPPTSEDFRYFHVHPVETIDGTVYAGRITAGGTHSSPALSLPATQRAYDAKETVAWVRATVDEYGILVCGPLVDDISPEVRDTVLSRRKVSGHWPEVGSEGDIYLAEILALSPGRPEDSEPGFPVGPVDMAFRAGRMVGLTAALGPDVETPTAVKVDVAAVTRQVYGMIKEEEAARTAAHQLLEHVLSADRQIADAARHSLAQMIGD